MNDEARLLFHNIMSAMMNGTSDDIIVRKYENDVIYCNDPGLSHFFVSHFKDLCDVETHSDIIYFSENPKFNYLISLIPGIDFQKHESVVLDSKDPYYCYLFAKDVKPTSVGIARYKDEVAEGLEELFGDNCLFPIERSFEVNADEALRMKIEEEILEEILGEELGLYSDIRIEVKNVNIDAHRKIVEEYGDEELIEKFKRDVDKVNDKGKSL